VGTDLRLLAPPPGLPLRLGKIRKADLAERNCRSIDSHDLVRRLTTRCPTLAGSRPRFMPSIPTRANLAMQIEASRYPRFSSYWNFWQFFGEGASTPTAALPRRLRTMLDDDAPA